MAADRIARALAAAAPSRPRATATSWRSIGATWLALAIGCRDPAPSPASPVSPTPLSATAEIALPAVLPSGGTMLGARKLTVTAPVPVKVTLLLEGDGTKRTIAFEELAATQDLPVLAMRLERDYTLTVTATDADDRTVTLPPIAIPGDPLPADWPVFDVVAFDPTRAWAGWTQTDTKRDYATTHLVFLDPDLQPAWVWSYVYDLQDVDLLGDGTLITRTDANGWLIDLLGNVIHQWGYEDKDDAHYLPTATEEFHHEIIGMGTRFAVLSSRTLTVPAYPTDYDHPTVLGGPADLRDPSLAVIDMATGDVESQWFMGDYLDTSRISFDSLNLMQIPGDTGDVYDWAHANAADVDLDGGYVVAMRHQDAIVKLDENGALVWILGDPAGWGDAWRPYLLAPVGDTRWPYHAHGVEVDDASGLVVMLDNGNNGRTPYTPPVDAPPVSRAVAYRVDAAAMTVEEVWSYDQTTDGPVFADAEGDARVLPNGNVFADYGLMFKQGNATNGSLGWGANAARLVEWAPDQPDAPVFDCRVRSDVEVEPKGWISYRATKIASPYPSAGPWRATDTWEEPSTP